MVTYIIHMHGFCTVIACAIGLHVPIGVMACTLITCLWSILLLKQPWVWTRTVSRYFLVRTTSMSCVTRLTAVAVGLSIVALDAKNAIAVSYQRCIGVTMLTDRRKSRHIYIYISRDSNYLL